MLLVGIAPLPIGYYTLLRIVVCGTFALGALTAFEKNYSGIAMSYGMLAALFNPFFPIDHGKVMWIVFDIVAIGILLATSKYVTENGAGESSSGATIEPVPSFEVPEWMKILGIMIVFALLISSWVSPIFLG